MNIAWRTETGLVPGGTEWRGRLTRQPCIDVNK